MQPKNSQEALSELQNFQNTRRKSQDVLRESETRLGLPTATQRQAGLRAAITNTENLIRAVPDSVAGRTGGSLVTDAQKTRLVGMERAPLDDSFREQSRAYEGESVNINELKRQAMQDTQLAIAEDDQKQSVLSGLYGTLYQREQDELARQEALRKEQAAAAQQAAYLSALSSGTSGVKGAANGTAPNPQNDARERATRIISGDIRAQASSYKGLLSAASRGDAMAKNTLAILDQLKPGLKNSYTKILSSNIGQPAAAPVQKNRSILSGFGLWG